MRHRKSGRKFGMTSAHRKALLRNLSDALIRYGSINTTVTRAKELRKIAERLITLAKEDSLHSKRTAASWLRTAEAFKKLFAEYKEQFKDRNGGYTRIVKTSVRHGDAAPMAYIEYINDAKKESSDKPRRRRRRGKTAKAEADKAQSAEA